ncbi:MAG: magnesium/cobalt transporter CorA [Gammaproteobacteria bacterium]|nr:magnesium/cobalt transporter CorA [Gammaproteobacteria bacterium]MCP5198709.1 magnesium/cobalt transporter CorA [Gammaproteobacteria bacterium]
MRPGRSPGLPVFVGERKRDAVHIHVIDYAEDGVTELAQASLDDCTRARGDGTVTWINVDGIHDVDMLSALGQRLGLHPLTVEDIANTTQRPKAEEFPHYIFLALKMILFDRASASLRVEHVSLVIGQGFVLTCLEDAGDVFDEVRERIRGGRGRIRTQGADYLGYALADAVVDHYFIALDEFGSHVDELDDAILDDPQPGHVHEIHRLKREAIRLRRAVWPLREEIIWLERSESHLISHDTHVYLRDLHDHTLQVVDMVDGYRDILGTLHDTYLSAVSNRLNEIMKVLTIISTVFIPLTFLVGVYGMNFRHMPELEWHWGYPLVWLVMVIIAVAMMLQFKRRGWW